MNIIGIGECGKNIANMFVGHNILTIDVENSNIVIEKQKDHQSYEENYRSLLLYFQNNQDNFIITSSGNISGILLRLLEELKEKNNEILYIVPDLELCSREDLLRHNVVFGILQELSRSGRFILNVASNSILENYIQDITIHNKFDKINSYIFNIIQTDLLLRNVKSLNNTKPNFTDFYKIGTYGYFDVDSGKELLLCDLEGELEKHYYFLINSDRLKHDHKILKQIQDTIKEKKAKNQNISYGIHPSPHSDACYILARTGKIQEPKKSQNFP